MTEAAKLIFNECHLRFCRGRFWGRSQGRGLSCALKSPPTSRTRRAGLPSSLRDAQGSTRALNGHMSLQSLVFLKWTDLMEGIELGAMYTGTAPGPRGAARPSLPTCQPAGRPREQDTFPGWSLPAHICLCSAWTAFPAALGDFDPGLMKDSSKLLGYFSSWTKTSGL